MKRKGSKSISPDKFILDSCGWIEYFSEGKNVIKYAKYIENASPKNYITPTIVLYEVYKRIRSVYNEEMAMEAIANIKYSTDVMDFSDNLAISAAEISLYLKIPMADAIILSTAKEYNATIITSDSHFKGMENVIFI